MKIDDGKKKCIEPKKVDDSICISNLPSREGKTYISMDASVYLCLVRPSVRTLLKAQKIEI